MKTFGHLMLLVAGFPVLVGAAEIRVVSQRATGLPPSGTGSGVSGAGEWSPDGQWVVFQSSAPEFVGLNNRGRDLNVFVRRLGVAGTTLVSVAADGARPGNGRSSCGQFAGGSSLVVFASCASDLVAGDANGVEDIFVRDLGTGVTRMVSLAPDGGPGSGASSGPTVTAGRWVLFDSLATNLVAGVTNGTSQVYLHDLSTGQTELAARGEGGVVAGAGSWEGRISQDGRWIAFLSRSTGLVTPQVEGALDLYVRDRVGGSVRRLGLDPLSTNLVSGVLRVRSFDLSEDGRFLAVVAGGGTFRTASGTVSAPVALWYDLVANDVRFVTVPGEAIPADAIRLASGGTRVFADVVPSGEVTSRVMAWDVAGGLVSLEQLAMTLPPQQVRCTNSELVDVIPDGSRLVMASRQLMGAAIGSAEPEEPLLYEWVVGTGAVRVLSAGPGGVAMGIGGMLSGKFAPGGVEVLFEASVALAEADRNRSNDLYLSTSGAGGAALVSVASPGVNPVTADGRSHLAPRSISADGRWVVFTSSGTDLAEPGVSGFPRMEVFLRDMVAGTNHWITRPRVLSGPAVGHHGPPVLAADGARVLLHSTQADLVDGDTNGVSDVFAHERGTGSWRLVSRGHGSNGGANGSSTLIAVDRMGRRVLFESQATDLVPGGTSGRNVFLADLETGMTTWVSTNAPTPLGLLGLEGVSRGGAISADGRWVAFFRSTSGASTGELVVRQESGEIFPVMPGLRTVSAVALSPDGGWVAFVEGSMVAPVSLRVCRLPGLEVVRQVPLGRVPLRSLEFTADSRRLLVATAVGLVAADTNGVLDVYLVGVEDGDVDWVSAGIGGVAAGDLSDEPSMSEDGRVVAFRTRSPEVALGSPARGSQVVVRDHAAGVTWRLSEPASMERLEPSQGVVVSGDGKWAVFASYASGLVPGDFNGEQDIFQVSLASPTMTDGDGDGLPDDWERWNLGTLALGFGDDPDGDALSNGREFQARTHPADAASGLELISPVLDGAEVVVRWQAVPGMRYELERAAGPEGPWQRFVTVAGASGGTRRQSDAVGEGSLFYRVRMVD